VKVFLDLDGTLIDVAPRHHRVYDEVTRELGGAPLAQPRYWSLKRRKTAWAELLPLSGLPAAVEGEYLDRFISRIERPDYLRADALFAGARDLLAAFAAHFPERYLVSLRRKPEALRAQLQWLQIDPHFTEILSGHSERDGVEVKTALIRERLRREPGVMIGDTEADVMAGKQLGMTTVAMHSGLRDEHFLGALGPDFLFGGLAELGAALPAITGARAGRT
jgi:phosphoglycolate phosphatase-like HAD superfamily hydrolase